MGQPTHTSILKQVAKNRGKNQRKLTVPLLRRLHVSVRWKRPFLSSNFRTPKVRQRFITYFAQDRIPSSLPALVSIPGSTAAPRKASLAKGLVSPRSLFRLRANVNICQRFQGMLPTSIVRCRSLKRRKYENIGYPHVPESLNIHFIVVNENLKFLLYSFGQVKQSSPPHRRTPGAHARATPPGTSLHR